ncbi:Cytochrome P450 monooxygenase [Pseudocercospora fuligena]|uniref:Cytochrome P450 monooxygenase n=1 Tax=Pseudocercospora fuligena TaxID=685502 RepID=A0A8H6VS67_9PEZI|nr:Cytochrome P450 monooxygenase [Pseudocercospora fuligena]
MLNSQAFLPFDRNVPHLIATAQNIIGPGTTTTAAFLTRTTFHILNNPRILSNLKAELNAAIPDPAMIPSSPDLEKLPYLTAVIHEGHRISHGVSHRLQRVAREPIIYKTWIIPAGTPVGMTPSIMAMNEDVFPNPKIFDPDRYLDTSGMVRRRKAAFNPFGKGPRSCLGINLATAEAYIILAMMFRRFDFELFETKREDVDVARDYFAALPKVGARGLRVLVRSSE